MRRSRIGPAGIVLLIMFLSPPVLCEEDNPISADDFRLVLWGGPPAIPVEISINGEFMALVDEPKPSVMPIGEILRPGVNELRVSVPEDAEAGPGQVEELRINVYRVVEKGKYQSKMDLPLAGMVIPGSLDPQDICDETIRFHIGPKPEVEPRLKNRFWLFIEGPPVAHRVHVLVNDTLIIAANAGHRIIELTPWIVKGKNTVTFEGADTCYVAPSGQQGPLSFVVTTGEKDNEVVRATYMPLAVFEVDKKRSKGEFKKTMKFRGW